VHSVHRYILKEHRTVSISRLTNKVTRRDTERISSRAIWHSGLEFYVFTIEHRNGSYYGEQSKSYLILIALARYKLLAGMRRRRRSEIGFQSENDPPQISGVKYSNPPPSTKINEVSSPMSLFRALLYSYTDTFIGSVYSYVKYLFTDWYRQTLFAISLQIRQYENAIFLHKTWN